MPKAKAPKKKANLRKEHAAFAALKAHTDSDKAAVLQVVRNAYDDIGPLDFQSSTQRASLRDHLRRCVRDLPKSISGGDHDRLVQGMYELVRDLRKTWGTRETKDKTTVQEPEKPQKPAVIEFDFSRHTVLPNIDVQVFRAGGPGGVLTYRLSDFLDEERPGARSSDGDWIDGTLLFADALIAELKKMKYMKSDSETLWWNPLPQHEVDTITQGANVAGEDEILMTEINFHSSLRRLIDSRLPNLRLNSESRGKLDMFDLGPPISLVIRPEDTTGGALKQTYTSILNPPGTKFGTSDLRDHYFLHRGQSTTLPLTPYRADAASLPKTSFSEGHTYKMPDRFSLTRQERAKLGKPLDPSVAMLGPRHGGSSPSQSNRDETSISGNRRPSSFGDTEDRKPKRKKVEPEPEVKTIFEKFEAQLKTFRDTFNGRNEKDYFLNPVNSVAAQLYVSLEQTSDNTKSEVVQEAIMDFFEIAADILKGICMMSNMRISRMAIDVVVKILTPISDAIIRMEIEDNAGTSISPFIDMGLLILEELFGKLDNGSDESGMPELVSICKVPMWTIFVRLNERDHPMASLFGLAHALVSETACYMKEFYLDTPREYLDGPMDIASAIIFEIHGRIEEGTTAENRHSTFIQLASSLIGLSLHKMMDGISQGVLEERVSRRLFHLLSLIHLFLPACVGQFDEKAKSGIKYSFVKICHIILRVIGHQTGHYGLETPRLFPFLQVLLSFGFPEDYEEQMSQLFSLSALGSGANSLAMKEKTASSETPPYDMEFLLAAQFAAIYNEVMLELIGGDYEHRLSANTLSALVQTIHTMLAITIDKMDEAEMVPLGLPSPETLHRFMIYFGAFSKMHPYDKKLNVRSETDTYPKIPRSKRTESIQQFVRGYAHFEAKYKGSKVDGSSVESSESKAKDMKQSFKPLIKFLHDGRASIPVDDAEDEVVTFDPSLTFTQRASTIIRFIGLNSGFVLPSIAESDEMIKNQLNWWVKDLTTPDNTGDSDDDSDQSVDRNTHVEMV